MSYRNTFVTSYIYQASKELEEVNREIIKIFQNWAGSGLVNQVDERGYGFYAGVFKVLYPEEYQNDLRNIIPELEKVTKIPFRLAILTEDGGSIIYEIRPK